jgi:hypothetical protein
LNGEIGLKSGDRVTVRVEAADEYDLWAHQVASEVPHAAVGAPA